MRFLIDNALSPSLAALLREAGHHAFHVRDLGLQHADDVAIFERAAARPSLILFRGAGSRRAERLAAVILANLPEVAGALEAGSIVTFDPSRVRVRALPIASGG